MMKGVPSLNSSERRAKRNGEGEEEADDVSSIEEEEGLSSRLGRGICGLHNYGNTCFLNANIQALSNCPPFCEYMRRLTHLPANSKHTKDKQSPSSGRAVPFLQRSAMAGVLGKVMRDMWSTSATEDSIPVAGPLGVLSELGAANPMFRCREQQDAHEALRCLIDRLHEQLKVAVPVVFEPGWKPPQTSNLNIKADSSTPPPKIEYLYRQSAVSDLFGGVLCNRITCSECGHHSDTHEHFYDLSLSLTREVQREIRGRCLSSQNSTQLAPSSETTSSIRRANSGLVGGALNGDSLVGQDGAEEQKTAPDAPHFSPKHSDTTSQRPLMSRQCSIPRSPCFNSSGLLSSITAPLTEWLGWGPSLALEDLLHHFCASEKMNGSNQYSCDRCKKKVDAVKIIKLDRVPEILVLHLKRFRHNGTLFGNSKVSTKVKFPIRHLDLQNYLSDSALEHMRQTGGSTLYNLAALVQHQGMSVNGGHYVAICQNRSTGHWYEFSDDIVTPLEEQAVLKKEPYLLFYLRQKKVNTYDEDMVALKRLSASAEPPFRGISLWWYLRWKYTSHPGPLFNHDRVCPHGRLKPYRGPYDPSHFVSLSKEAWDFLQDKYGPTALLEEFWHNYKDSTLSRPLEEMTVCTECLKCGKQAAESRNTEKAEAQRLNAEEVPEDQELVWYIVDAVWLDRWRVYITADPKRDIEEPLDHPGPITNQRLLEPDTNNPRPNLQKTKHYKGLNPMVWEFFLEKYGGGPAICRKSIDIYADVAIEEEKAQL